MPTEIIRNGRLEEYRPTVSAQRPKGACRIAFVGEAPGQDEIEKGRPFCGPSGRVFDAMLRTAGFDRAEFWVGNVFGEKLPFNEVGNWCARKKEAEEGGFDDLPPLGSAGWLKPEHRHWLKSLEEEIEKFDPTVIVPLGGTALWAFTGSTNIAAARGAVTEATNFCKGRKLVPTFHPALVMRQWKYYTIVVGDFIKSAKEADKGPNIIWPKKELWLRPTLFDLELFENRIFNADLVSVDIETGWDQITCIGFAPNATEAICIPFVDLRQASRSYWKTPGDECQAWVFVRRWLEWPNPKLGQNFGGYDAFWLLAKMGIRPVNYREDTRLLHHALYPELPKDLAFLGASYTDQGPWKTMRSWHKEKRDD